MKVSKIDKSHFFQLKNFPKNLLKSVPERDRRDLYEDLAVQLAKREKENARMMRKNNMCKLTQVLHDLEKLTHKTLWKEAQDMLSEEAVFNDDPNLQNMDKEDALVCFEQVVKVSKSRFFKIEFIKAGYFEKL